MQEPCGTALAGQAPDLRLSDVMLAALAVLSATVLSGGVTRSVMGPDVSPILLWAGAQSGLWLAMVGSALLICRARFGSLQPLGLVFRRTDPALGVTLGVGAQLALVPLIYFVLSPFVDAAGVSDDAQSLLDRLGGGWNLVALTFGLVFIAPVVEELFFRGLVLHILAGRLGRTWV